MALVTFFSLLQEGDYTAATDYYGGSYEVLQEYNPDIDPSDYATLLRNGCSINGFYCLKVLRYEVVKRLSPDDYLFMVEFATREGELFILGPCCGASETEQPPVSSFNIRVVRGSDGRFRVADLPPFSP